MSKIKVIAGLGMMAAGIGTMIYGAVKYNKAQKEWQKGFDDFVNQNLQFYQNLNVVNDQFEQVNQMMNQQIDEFEQMTFKFNKDVDHQVWSADMAVEQFGDLMKNHQFDF